MTDQSLINEFWLIFCSVLVLIMQAGFLCLESGLTRSKNAINVALKNAMDLLLTVLVFWLVGFGIMFSGDGDSSMSAGHWFVADFGQASLWQASFFLFQLTFCATAATIVSGAIAERTRFSTYIMLTLAICTFIYPVYGSWAWGGIFGGSPGWLEAKGFIDFAGSTVVHSVGGWVSLAAIIVVGPRTGRFDGNQLRQIPASNLPMAMLGILFFMVGWIGFNSGSALTLNANTASIILNTIIAATAGGTAAATLHLLRLTSINISELALNGTLAGLVAITANCHAVTTPEAAIIGTIGAFVSVLATHLLIRWRLDDAVGAVPVHLAAGIWGTLAVALFGNPETLGTGLSTGQQFLVQLEGVIICGLYTFIISLFLLWIINRIQPLRVSVEAEEIGLNVSEHGASTELNQLMQFMTVQEYSGDMTRRAPVEPFTEVGMIANRYNAVMDKLEQTMQRTRLIIKDMRDGIITCNESGVISSFNPGAENIFKTNALSAIGQHVGEFFHPKNNEMFSVDHRELLLNLISHSPDYTHTVFGRRADGSAFDIEVSTSSSKTATGTQHTAVIRDVSERKRMEEQVHRHSQIAQVTLESIREAVINCSNNARIIYLNPAAQRLTGCSNEEAFEKNIDEVVRLSSVDNRSLSILELLSSADISEGDLILTSKTGETYTVSCNWSKLRASDQRSAGFVLALRDVTKSRTLEKQLTYQAAHDALTGLINRRGFEIQLDSMIAQAKREDSHHLICYLDLDQFKLVNDTCGHNAGDELLRQLSEDIKGCLRQSDYLARLGGDEFAVLLSHCDLETGVAIAEKIRINVQSFRFSWNNQSFSVGVSIGIVEINKHTLNQSEIMSQADTACYAAKDLGRNRVHVYKAKDQELNERRGEMQWASSIQSAIDQDRFRLYYQSISSTRNIHEKIHYEIFVRMLDEKGNIVPPGAFIPAAERYHLMRSIDRWVVKNTFAWMSDQIRGGQLTAGCAINLSGASVGDEQFLEEIKTELLSHPEIARQVCFEITETAAMSNLRRAQYFIEELKALGCKFALDDFGSGLSSFGYLKNLSVDYLKIDGIFIRELENNSVDQAMVESINTIGHIMKLKTIAEYVENENILNILQKIGIDYVQGYHIDTPQPLELLGGAKIMMR